MMRAFVKDCERHDAAPCPRSVDATPFATSG
jgi:hypothetical protein